MGWWRRTSFALSRQSLVPSAATRICSISFNVKLSPKFKLSWGLPKGKAEPCYEGKTPAGDTFFLTFNIRQHHLRNFQSLLCTLTHTQILFKKGGGREKVSAFCTHWNLGLWICHFVKLINKSDEPKRHFSAIKFIEKPLIILNYYSVASTKKIPYKFGIDSNFL